MRAGTWQSRRDARLKVARCGNTRLQTPDDQLWETATGRGKEAFDRLGGVLSPKLQGREIADICKLIDGVATPPRPRVRKPDRGKQLLQVGQGEPLDVTAITFLCPPPDPGKETMKGVQLALARDENVEDTAWR